MLFGAQRFDRVLARGDAGGDEARDKRERHADDHERRAARHRQDGVQALDTRQVVHDEVDRDDEQQRDADADGTGAEALDERLRVEHARDVALARADGAQDADLLRALEHGDIGDDAYHY